MTPIIYALVRFFKQESHRDDFLRGDLYMNRLRYFKHYEEAEKCNIGDKHEGLTGWIQPDDVKMKIENNKTGETFYIDGFVKPVRLGYLHHDDYHVYCMSALYFDDETDYEDLDALRTEVMLKLDRGDLGDYCSVIFGVEQFFSRLDKMLFDEDQKDHNVGRGLVQYYDADTFSGTFDGDDAFLRKANSFSHQREFRIFTWNGTKGNNPRILNIGDLSDIVFNCHKSEFNKYVTLG